MVRPTDVHSPRFYAAQNAIAAAFFAALLLAELVRRLLDWFPRSQALWQLTSLSNLTVTPALRLAESWTSSPSGLLLSLLAGLLLPLYAWRRRSWLATAVAGHITLIYLAVLSYYALLRNVLVRPLASLSSSVAPDAHSVAIVALTIAMLGCCMMNHYAYLKRAFFRRK